MNYVYSSNYLNYIMILDMNMVEFAIVKIQKLLEN